MTSLSGSNPGVPQHISTSDAADEDDDHEAYLAAMEEAHAAEAPTPRGDFLMRFLGTHAAAGRDDFLRNWHELQAAQKRTAAAPPRLAVVHGQQTSGPDGERERRYAQAALRSEAETLALTAPGSRNHTLNSAAFKLTPFVIGGQLARDEMLTALWQSARAAGLDDNEIRATIASGEQGAQDKLGARVIPDRMPDDTAASREIGPAQRAGAGAEGECHADDDTPRPWQEKDLNPYLSGAYDPPKPIVGERNDGVGMVYPGKLHTISSESEAGKTWAALAIAGFELRNDHHVVYVDFEDGESGVVGRLMALQLPPARIAGQFHYLRPTEALGYDVNRADLLTSCAKYRPTLAIIDGVTEGMVMHGLDPLSNRDIATFGRILPKLLANTGAAVLCLDHVVKSAEARGRYALGGVHKLNAVDGAAFILENRDPIGIDLTGRSAILIAKDRPGQLRKHSIRRKDGMHLFADMVVTSHHATYVEVEFLPAVDRPAEFRPTRLMVKICAALAEHGPMTQRQILATVGGRREYAADALALLRRDGYVSDKTPHAILKPFTEEDPDA